MQKKAESGQNQNAPDVTKKTGNAAPPTAQPKTDGTGAAPAVKRPLAKGSKWAKLAGNGTVKKSLKLPADGDGGSVRSGSIGSGPGRRESKLSLGSQLSGLDLSKIQAQQVQQVEETENDKSKNNQVSNDSYLKSAIPFLPQWVAIVCLIINIFLPGIGTIVSGFCIFCCGKPRVITKGDPIVETFCVNVWVGVVQLCTVTFMLVGWFWSFVWGIYMIILASDYRKMKKAAKPKDPENNNRGYVAF